MTLNASSLGKLLAGSGRNAAALIAAGSAGKPLPSFRLRDRLSATFTIRQRDIASPNVLAMLPGSDPKLANQAILLGAHLDGYGYGEPVNGDRLYNGTLDDAAYVALLIRLAERRDGEPFRRPVIFAAWTGEEKGLLGSRWFVAHPVVPLSRIAGNINLDQLRPIFPLKLLTVHGLDDSSLGDDARSVANGLGIAVQNDPEPKRNLLHRTDHWPFMQAGVPAVNFVFGFRPGSKSEQVYRQWYRTGYHKPQDDLKQPMDFKAAGDFNRFFYALVKRAADAAAPPKWKATSALKPR
jgi:Zn-dependent M28 family amino/carboxypeptidase